MNFYHIHKFRNSSDAWYLGQEITSIDINPYFRSLISNCESFCDTDSNELVRFDDFYRMVDHYRLEVIQHVRGLQKKHIENLERELVFECVRNRMFPKLPSRIRCLYTSDSLVNSKYWLSNVIGTSKNSSEGEYSYQIVEITVSDNTKIFRTNDSALWDCSGLSKAGLVRRAFNYWNAKGDGQVEWLIEGDFKVVNILCVSHDQI